MFTMEIENSVLVKNFGCIESWGKKYVSLLPIMYYNFTRNEVLTKYIFRMLARYISSLCIYCKMATHYQ
jgi:hypothetical protein